MRKMKSSKEKTTSKSAEEKAAVQTETDEVSAESSDSEESNMQDELWVLDSTEKKGDVSDKELDDNESDKEDVFLYSISEKMLTLMDSAIFRREILTGELVGVRRTSYGIVASVIYNANVNSLDFDSVTVQISADEMGLNNIEIERFIRERAKRKKEKLPPTLLRRRKQRYQAAILNAMLGATIDFIPTSIEEGSKAVIASRALAMEEKRHQLPANSINRLVDSRVLRVNPVQLVVEVSGYEVTMSPSELTPMAVNFTQFFSPGDTFRVRIVDMTSKGPKVVSAKLKRIDVEKKVMEYKPGDIVKGTLYFYFARSGKYYVRMPNGCRGEVYYESTILSLNPHIGDSVRMTVRGYSRDKTYVRCQINSII